VARVQYDEVGLGHVDLRGGRTQNSVSNDTAPAYTRKKTKGSDLAREKNG